MSDWVHLEVESIDAETEKAFRLRLEIDGDVQLQWVPKSVGDDAHEYKKGMTGCTVSVKTWFAEKEGLL